jgi:hypothetical protein
MSETKHAKIIRVLSSNLTHSRLNENSDDPTLHGFWNCFALLGVPEDTNPDLVPELASRARQKAKIILEGLRKSDADAGVACNEFATRYSVACENLRCGTMVQSHLRDIRERRMSALCEAAAEMAMAGASDPERALSARVIKIGFLPSDQHAAVAEALAIISSPHRHDGRTSPERGNNSKDEPTRSIPELVRPKLGLGQLVDFVPLVISAGASALVLTFSAPVEVPSTIDVSVTLAEEPTTHVPVVRDVLVSAVRSSVGSGNVIGPPWFAEVAIEADPRDGESLQYQYRIPSDSPAWTECEATFMLPVRSAEQSVDFRVVDASGKSSSIVSRTVPSLP